MCSGFNLQLPWHSYSARGHRDAMSLPNGGVKTSQEDHQQALAVLLCNVDGENEDNFIMK